MKDDKLIVGVFGTQCTGKSTFINDVVANTAMREDPSMRWTIFGDNYRDVIASKGLSINRDGNEECQKVIHGVLMNNILKAVDENNLKRIIMDRTIIDSFAYTFWHFAYGKGGIDPKTLEIMWNHVCRYSKMFNALVYIPLEKCGDVILVDDKFRDTDVEYRKQIDKIMKAIWLSLAGENCNMSVIYGSRQDRVRDFTNCVEYLMENGVTGRFASIKEFSARVLVS